MATLLLFAKGAESAPVISVRGRAQMALDPIRSTARDTQISGVLRDLLTGEPVVDAVIEVWVDGKKLRALTNEKGRFLQVVSGLRRRHTVKVVFSGTKFYALVATERQSFTVGKPSLAIEIRATPTKDHVALVVRASARGRAVAIVGELYGGAPSGRLVAFGAMTTNRAGYFEVDLPRAPFGPPGRKQVVVRCRGSSLYNPAVGQVFFDLRRDTHLQMALASTEMARSAALKGKGQLRDDQGQGIAGALITLHGRGERLASALTDHQGEYEFELVGSELSPGPLAVHAQFSPTKGWLGEARSELVALTLVDRGSVPTGCTLAAFSVSAAVFLSFIGLRRKPWRRGISGEDSGVPRASAESAPAEPLCGGLSQSPARIASILRRPKKQTFSGRVVEAVTRRPVVGAQIQVEGDQGLSYRILTCAKGAFRVQELAEGRWQARVGAAHYVTESFVVTIPHRGEFCDVQIDLVPVRERIFDLYRRVAARVLPEPQLWGVWTPRQIIRHVAGQARGHRELATFTEFVEDSYFSQRVPDESALPRARALLAAAQAEAESAASSLLAAAPRL